MSDPYVLLGLSRTRQRWFSDVARWSTSGAAPIEFVKCLTVEEARAVLGAGRRLSALLVDGGTPGLDRDLIADVRGHGAVTLVGTDGRVLRDWDSLGCAATLHPTFSPDELLAALEQHARPVERHAHRPTHLVVDAAPPRSHLISVTGAGGAGSSTVAMCLAQALARGTDSLALVDGARLGDLAMYHDVGDVIPGLPELVDAHRVDEPDPDRIRELLFTIEDRGYDLLLGLRGPRDWVAMRPHSLRAAIAGLERAYDTVVVDHDPDLEGEDLTGSVGVEDRHAVARVAVHRADLVLAVGLPGVKGVQDLARLIRTIAAEGVPPDRVLPVVNRCPRSPAARAATTRALAELTPRGDHAPPPPLFLRAAGGVESAHRGASGLPEVLCRPLGRAARRLLLQLGSREQHGELPAIRPGELGTDRDVLGDWPAGLPHGHSDVA
jgi:MinD-like ATPase involved in chromosome partitioning or flagellar assembly